jgi:hypothetical protein
MLGPDFAFHRSLGIAYSAHWQDYLVCLDDAGVVRVTISNARQSRVIASARSLGLFVFPGSPLSKSYRD